MKMKVIMLGAILAVMLGAPAMAAKDSDQDRTQSDVQTPGKTEPKVPDTLKPNADERIQSKGRESEKGISTEGRAPVEEHKSSQPPAGGSGK